MFTRVVSFSVWLGLSSAALAQVLPHNTQYMSNGTITIGRDMDGGGAITYLTDGTHGGNVVNNHDSGRQIQSAVFDITNNVLYNPTQAGDGCHWTPVSSQSWLKKSNDYIYSSATPLVWIDNGCVPTDPAIPATGSTFGMWTEFLPGEPRAFTVKVLYRFSGNTTLHGQSHGQQVIPVAYQNGLQFTDHMTYTGKQPWTSQPIETIDDTTVSDFATINVRMTENWSAIVGAPDTDPDVPWGVATMSTSCANLVMFCGPDIHSCSDDGTTGDAQSPCKVHGHLQRFALDHSSGGPDQLREGRLVGFVGDVNDARVFFEQYRRLPTGDTSVYTFDGDYLDWEPNATAVQQAAAGGVQGNAVRMGPSADLSLLGKNWGVGTYSVRTRLEPTTQPSGWWGLAICKAGEQHYEVGPGLSGYYLVAFDYTDAVNTYVKVLRRDLATSTSLGSVLLPGFVRTNWNDLSVDVVDAGTTLDLVVSVNGGAPVLTATDSTKAFTNGYVSLVVSQRIESWFDDFQVTNATGDSTAPAPVTGLTAQGNGSQTQIDLAWTPSTSSDRLWTRVVRKEGSTPAHWRDGIVAYEGKLAAYTDIDVALGHDYTYAVYVCDRAGNWSTAATASASPLGRWQASTDFSSAQGDHDWHYRYLQGSYLDMSWDAANSRWFKDGSGGSQAWISAGKQVPSKNQAACRVWTAPVAGSAHVVGFVKKDATGGNGCAVTILKIAPGGVTELYGVTIAASDTTNHAFDLTASVNAGDEIVFREACISTNVTGDTVSWDPTIELQ